MYLVNHAAYIYPRPHEDILVRNPVNIGQLFRRRALSGFRPHVFNPSMPHFAGKVDKMHKQCLVRRIGYQMIA